jgi:hypothetical protein
MGGWADSWNATECGNFQRSSLLFWLKPVLKPEKTPTFPDFAISLDGFEVLLFSSHLMDQIPRVN